MNLRDQATDDSILGEEFDGIEISENPPPTWWKWVFILSILFAPAYLFFYHNGAEGRSLAETYEARLADNLQLQFAEIGNLAGTRSEVVEFLYKPTWLQIGKVTFKSHCASCHGPEGGGRVGPNLTDDRYKNVRDIGDILRIVQKGANAGAMPAWESRLSTNEMVLVSSYVASLRGTTPAVAIDPEGTLASPWPEPPAETTESEAESDGQPAAPTDEQADNTSGS